MEEEAVANMGIDLLGRGCRALFHLEQALILGTVARITQSTYVVRLV